MWGLVLCKPPYGYARQPKSMNPRSNKQFFCTSRWIRHKTENFDSKLSLYLNDNSQVFYRSNKLPFYIENDIE